MIPKLPLIISLVFGATVILTLILFFVLIQKSENIETSKKARPIILLAFVWIVLQSSLSLLNLYNSDFASFPPKIAIFGIFPTIILIAFLFFSTRGKAFIDSLPLKYLTFIHIVRIPVEIVLLSLFLNKVVPQLMTFEGRNFDILAGISAPAILYFGIIKGKLNRKILLLWNFVSLGLLLNTVVNAFLSTPSPVQQFAFDQANIAILYFPFSLLPTFIVPIVLFSHLASIKKLLASK